MSIVIENFTGTLKLLRSYALIHGQSCNKRSALVIVARTRGLDAMVQTSHLILCDSLATPSGTTSFCPSTRCTSSTMASQALGSSERTALIRNAFPKLNPLDRYRIAIVAELSRIESSIDIQSAFAGLDRTNNAAHGDLVLAVPRLRLKIPPAELAHKLAAEVCT